MKRDDPFFVIEPLEALVMRAFRDNKTLNAEKLLVVLCGHRLIGKAVGKALLKTSKWILARMCQEGKIDEVDGNPGNYCLGFQEVAILYNDPRLKGV